MPRRSDISSILIIGAGPIIIGQACEFDYSGTQACKALKEEGYRIILINSNPATIMTDPGMADATYIEPITDKDLIASKYSYWRLRIGMSIFWGYIFYYLTRKNFAAIMPIIGIELALTKAQLGIILSLSALSYGLSKFFMGVLSDRCNPRYFMSFGLFCTGIMNICLGIFSFSSQSFHYYSNCISYC